MSGGVGLNVFIGELDWSVGFSLRIKITNTIGP